MEIPVPKQRQTPKKLAGIINEANPGLGVTESEKIAKTILDKGFFLTDRDFMAATHFTAVATLKKFEEAGKIVVIDPGWALLIKKA